eukprot:TRINITY_DN4156_c0_g1_i2.p1 TRINITY_DN4156_c0_g1~~TRINITY_DN4156_c0_g1_i2.p1  ORF type:complete len:105 (-),score=11.24 TRINITY_DN4156_c0_g1_i2:20-334(-)
MPATSAWQASGPSADSKRDPDASSPVASPARPRAVRQSVHETHSPARDDQPAPAARTASSAFGIIMTCRARSCTHRRPRHSLPCVIIIFIAIIIIIVFQQRNCV